MARFGDAGHNLDWMEEELLEDEYEDEYDEEDLDEEYDEVWDEEDEEEYEAPRHRFRRRSPAPPRRVFEPTEYDEDAAVPLPAENRKVGKLLLLLLLEIAAIAAIVRWWLQWW